MIALGDGNLSVQQILDICDGKQRCGLSAHGRERVNKSASHVESIVNNSKAVYGINTGFGPLCDTRISGSQTRDLQQNLLLSHSVGVGNSIDITTARLMLITKAHALAFGYSGIRAEIIDRILLFIENHITPCVPEKGSVGASGDLAPLAHLFLPLIGFGEVYHRGERRPARHVLNEYGLEPIQLGPKEGLALINGTQFILANAILVLKEWKRILDLADVSGALALESLKGSASPFDSRLHNIRPFAGSVFVASRLRKLLDNSEVLQSHVDCDRVQDPYSLRCMPQVHGASRNAWLHLKDAVTIELNSVTDNPVVFSEKETISGGNFHGQPLALPLDYAAFASAELGNISDRRSYLMIEGRYDLPKLLIKNAGLNSGLMIPQYTTAALVTENKTLCYPASADSVPTSLGQEDHVSMGSISGRKTRQILNNLDYIFAIELLYASQALEFRRPLKSSAPLEHVQEIIRSRIPFIEQDRLFADDINILHTLVTDHSFIDEINNTYKLYDGYESFELH